MADKTLVLTNYIHGRTFGLLRQNPQPGLKLRTTRRPTRPQCVFFHGIYFSYDPGARARNGGCYLVAVVSTCASRITKIEALAPRLTHTQGAELMANDNTNPFTAPIRELEEIEYDLRMTIELLNDQIELSEFDNGVINKPRANYLIGMLFLHSRNVTKAYEDLFEAWRATKSVIDALQHVGRAA